MSDSMLITVHIFLTLFLLFGLLYINISLMAWTFLLFVVMTAATLIPCEALTPPMLFTLWAVFIAFGLLNIKPLRRLFITGPVFKIFKKILPPMSQTERDALDAGSVWWDGDLFSGTPKWDKLFNYKLSMLNDSEQKFLDTEVTELCKMLDDWKITDELRDLPPEVWKFLKEKNFFGMIIGKQYGGLGFTAYAHSQVVQKVASRSLSAAVTIMVPNSLGPAELLHRYGTKEQKDHYLPRLADGRDVPCFALTSPRAGSDAGAIPDSGVVCKGTFNGEEILGLKLNWDKRYITLGPVATVLGLAFKLYDPNKLLSNDVSPGITLALIPTDLPGVEIGARHAPLNAVFQVGPNYGKDVFVPLDFIIGGSEQIGNGWLMLMDCLASGRSISLPALSSGSSKLAARFIGAYARVRKQFNTPIGKFEGIEELLARVGGYTYIIDSARHLTASTIDNGEEPSVLSAIVKYHLTELNRKLINDAVDIQGGGAICLGPKNLLGRAYQSLPIGITVEGANVLTRSMIIFGQGAVRCHPFVFLEMEAVKNDNLKDFDKAFCGHVNFTITNQVRAFIRAITFSKCVKSYGTKGVTKKYIKSLTRYSSAFAFTSDLLMLYLGGSLKRKERISARLGDILSNLYLASAVLNSYKHRGSLEKETPLLIWSMEELLYNIENAFYELFKNLPFFITVPLKIVCFPLGRTYKGATDKMGHLVSKILINPSKTRDELTKDIFMPTDVNERLNIVEQGFLKCIEAEEIEKKIYKAVKNKKLEKKSPTLQDDALKENIITKEERNILFEAEELRDEVISVDSPA